MSRVRAAHDSKRSFDDCSLSSDLGLSKKNNRPKAMPSRNSGSRSSGLNATSFATQLGDGATVAGQSLKPGTGANQQSIGGTNESNHSPASAINVCRLFSFQITGETNGKSK